MEDAFDVQDWRLILVEFLPFSLAGCHHVDFVVFDRSFPLHFSDLGLCDITEGAVCAGEKCQFCAVHIQRTCRSHCS